MATNDKTAVGSSASDSASQPASANTTLPVAASVASGGASQPAAPQMPLALLNANSAKVGRWHVQICNAHMHAWSYTKSGQPKEAKAFRCHLVVPDQPESYCLAEVIRYGPLSESKLKSLAAVQAKFKDGLEFIISKVALDAEIKQEYLSTPVKICVHLEKTACNPVLQSRGAIQPAPNLSCAECVEIKQRCAFDITALIARVSEPRGISGLRYIRDVYLIDGAKIEEKSALPKISLYYNRSSMTSDPQHILDLQADSGTSKPLTFHGLHGEKTAEGFKIQSSSDCFWKEATWSVKAKDLSARSSEIHGIPTEQRETIGSVFAPQEKRDWSLVPGHETICAHMALLLDKTDVNELDDSETVWQINWCEIAVSPSADGALKSKDGSRLWVRVTLRDCSSHVALHMTEDSVLQLSGLSSADEFIHKYEDGDYVFPILASVKIRRIVKKSSTSDATQLAATSQEGAQMTSVVIVHATEQPWEEHRTQGSMAMVAALRRTANAASQMIPAELAMIVSSGQYPLGVQYGDKTVPCLKVLTLIASSVKSKAQDAGEDAFVLRTAGVVDALNESEARPTYTIIAMCRRDNQAAFRLDPPRGNKPQHALAILTATTSEGFVAEQIQLVQDGDAEQIKNALRMEMTLARALGLQMNCALEKWSPTVTPLQSKTCRALGRSPTGEALPKYQAR